MVSMGDAKAEKEIRELLAWFRLYEDGVVKPGTGYNETLEWKALRLAHLVRERCEAEDRLKNVVENAYEAELTRRSKK